MSVVFSQPLAGVCVCSSRVLWVIGWSRRMASSVHDITRLFSSTRTCSSQTSAFTRLSRFSS